MTSGDGARRDGAGEKQRQLDADRINPEGTYLTTNQGVRVDDTDNTLTPGERGPSLLEDFHFREKVMHFDQERIPERVVHARGSGAYGYFQPYESLAGYTMAEFLQDPNEQTPVFVRFSTVAGSKGSADTPRDVRGFATKFYTRAGNFDLVGNNFPVFFIQDGIKFPDFVHAVKPEPDSEMPQAASAHDTLWDFVQLQPETMHTIMWLMSDRSIPRSLRMMQGFGVHTFRLVNAQGQATFAKFHWTPMLGSHSLVWDEAQKCAGKDPDFNRRDLWEAIEAGHYPQWELGVQLVSESDEHAFDFDLLDATKIIPEEQVPVRPIGKMTLNRNPENFFAETEQVAFHIGHVVPGIDFTNDPLLQARLFSYLDTQLIRLGGPNFAQLPVNRPIAEVHNNQRQGYGQVTIHQDRASYEKNSIMNGQPAVAGPENGGFEHYQEKVEGRKIRKRSESFNDHYSQATLFWNSMADWEKAHIIGAFRFELGKVTQQHIREYVVEHLNHVDHGLAVSVAEGVGVTPPKKEAVPNHGNSSPALSLANSPHESIDTRHVAVLVGDGVDGARMRQVTEALESRGAVPDILAPHDGAVRESTGQSVQAGRQLMTVASVLYDAVFIPPGEESAEALRQDGDAVHFITEAFKHGKPIGAIGAGVRLLDTAGMNGVQLATAATGVVSDRGVVTRIDDPIEEFVEEFATAIAQHRHFDRAHLAVPA